MVSVACRVFMGGLTLAALLCFTGCSSSDAGMPSDGVVEMPPEEMPPDVPMPSEEELGLITAVHAMSEDNWLGHQSGANWGIAASTRHQGSPDDPVGRASAVWLDASGDLQVWFDISARWDRGQEVQTDPVRVLTGRVIDTSLIGDQPAGLETTRRELSDHGLGAEWRGLEATKTYDDGSQVVVELYTDAKASDNLLNPSDTDFRRDVRFDSVNALPSGRDYQYFLLSEAGLPGTLDGKAGRFNCVHGAWTCGFSTDVRKPGRFNLLRDAVFSPDDGSGDEQIAPYTWRPVPAADYLSFGNWRSMPADTSDAGAYEFGLFATVGDPFAAGTLAALSGTAQYTGDAVGVHVKSAAVDAFAATVELSVDFGSATEFGTVTGRVFDITLGSGDAAPLEEIGLLGEHRRDEPHNLFATSFGDDSGTPVYGGIIVGGISAAEGWRGTWGGAFGGNGADHPTSLAGTFTATGELDGEAASFAGAFGAHRE